MQITDLGEEFKLCLRSGIRCIWIKTYDENSVVEEIQKKSAELQTNISFKVNDWSASKGMETLPIFSGEKKTLPNNKLALPVNMFEYIMTQEGMRKEDVSSNNIFIMKDLDVTINHEWRLTRYIKDIFNKDNEEIFNILVIISTTSNIPESIKDFTYIIDIEPPSKENIADIVNDIIEFSKGCEGFKKEYTEEEKKEIINNVTGFEKPRILKLLSESLARNNEINTDFLKKAKVKALRDDSILTFKEPKVTMEDIGGYNNIKKWLKETVELFDDEARAIGLPTPKGYMSVGIAGCGKTMFAEAFAGSMNIPLIELSIDKIMNKLVGESEQRIEKALNVVKANAPCVMLIDEVEKVLGGIQSSNRVDGGVTNRILASLLKFMQDNDNGVYVIMTSNDVSQLPPEFTRAGRLDATWFFGLPDKAEREAILRHYIKQYSNIQVSKTVLDIAVENTETYTGAELKEVISNFVKKIFIKTKKKLAINQEHLIEEAISEIIPIAKSSKEKINILERWCEGRARNASIKETNEIKSILKKNNTKRINSVFSI